MRIFRRISFDPDKLLRQTRICRFAAALLLILMFSALSPAPLSAVLLAAGIVRLGPAFTGRSAALRLLALGSLAAGTALRQSVSPITVLSACLLLSAACKGAEWYRVRELTGALYLLFGGLFDAFLSFRLGGMVIPLSPRQILALHLLASAGTACAVSCGYARLERIMRGAVRPRGEASEQDEL